MSYKNFFIYVQKQINRFLKLHRVYAKIYVNNIVIFSKILKKHEQYFRQIFITLQINNISIKFEKVFLKYSSVQFLNQKNKLFRFCNDKKQTQNHIEISILSHFSTIKNLFEFDELITRIHDALCRNRQIIAKSKNETFSFKFHKK